MKFESYSQVVLNIIVKIDTLCIYEGGRDRERETENDSHTVKHFQ